MLTVAPSIFPKNPSLTRLGNTSQPLQAGLCFSGDAFAILQKLKAAKQSRPAPTAKKPNRAAKAPNQDEAFKKICDVVVWKQDDQTLTVGDMVAFLCRIRNEDEYPGYGTVETLAKHFPGMKVKVLKKGFERLHLSHYCLGKDDYTQEFWLRAIGEEMIERLYPGTLPPKEGRYTISKRSIAIDGMW